MNLLPKQVISAHYYSRRLEIGCYKFCGGGKKGYSAYVFFFFFTVCIFVHEWRSSLKDNTAQRNTGTLGDLQSATWKPMKVKQEWGLICCVRGTGSSGSSNSKLANPHFKNPHTCWRRVMHKNKQHAHAFSVFHQGERLNTPFFNF